MAMKDRIFSARGHMLANQGSNRVRRSLVTFTLLVSFGLTSQATNITWIGGNGLGGNGAFDIAIDWNPNQIPGAGDAAIFNDTPGTIYTVGLNISNEVVGSVSVSNSVYQLSWLAN